MRTNRPVRSTRLSTLAALALTLGGLSWASTAAATQDSSPAVPPTGTALALPADAEAACAASIPLIPAVATAMGEVRAVDNSTSVAEAKEKITVLMQATKTLAASTGAALDKVGAANGGAAATQAATYNQRAAAITQLVDEAIASLATATTADELAAVFSDPRFSENDEALNINLDEFAELRAALEGGTSCTELHREMSRMGVEDNCTAATRSVREVISGREQLDAVTDADGFDMPRNLLVGMLVSGNEMNSHLSKVMTTLRSLANSRLSPHAGVVAAATEFITREATITAEVEAAVEQLKAATTIDEVSAVLSSPEIADNSKALDLGSPTYADVLAVMQQIPACATLIELRQSR